MGIGDGAPDAAQPPRHQAAEENLPELVRLRLPHVGAQPLPLAARLHPNGHHGGHVHHPAVLADLDGPGVEPVVGILRVRRAVAIALHPLLGFVDREPDFPPDRFVARFGVTGCTADAMPYGVFVQASDAEMSGASSWGCAALWGERRIAAADPFRPANLAVTDDSVADGRQFREADRAAGVKLLGGDAHLGAEAEFAPVRKAG